MKQNDIYNLPLLNSTNYENIFNIYQDKDSRFFYNLLQTVVVPDNLPEAYFGTYVSKPQDTLPYISYKTLGRIDLWWVLAHFNGINNPTITIEVGTTFKIPNLDVVDAVIDALRDNT